MRKIGIESAKREARVGVDGLVLYDADQTR